MKDTLTQHTNTLASQQSVSDVLTNIDFGISQYQLIKFLVMGVLLFFVLRLVKNLLGRFNRKEYLQAIDRFFALFELFLWVLFFIWSAQAIFLDKTIYSIGILLVVFIVLIWFCLVCLP